jgi:hypothetical protein
VPTDVPPSPATGLHRRTALGALVALGAVTAGCVREGPRRQVQPPPPKKPQVDPDVALVTTVLAAEQGVLDLVEAVMQRHRRLRPLLASTRDAHRVHTQLLADAVPKSGVSPSASSTPTPAAVPWVPADPDRALAALTRAEDDLTLVDKRSSFAAESGAFARILASMAAAAAQHSVLLRQHVRGGAAR